MEKLRWATGPHRRIMKNVVLNNGVEMPILGFGVFQIEVNAAAEEVRICGHK